jgi:hypothetical protein
MKTVFIRRYKKADICKEYGMFFNICGTKVKSLERRLYTLSNTFFNSKLTQEGYGRAKGSKNIVFERNCFAIGFGLFAKKRAHHSRKGG